MSSGIPFRHRLQTRMILAILIFLALLMLITTYAGIRRERQAILAQMERDGIALAQAYALSVENALLLKKAGLARVTGEASRAPGIAYLKIIDRDGRIIGHTDPTRIGLADDDPLCRLALAAPITAVERGKTPLTDITRGPREIGIYRVVIPLVTLGAVRGALEIGLDMATITEAVARTNRQSLLIALAAFAASGAYIWFFARSLTRPVKDLVRAAERAAGGDLGPEIAVGARGEIAHLAAAFNHMTQALKSYTDDLKRTNTQLEADAATIEKLRRYTENILASIRPGVLTVDLAGRVTTLNRAGAAILGLDDGAEAVGRPVAALFPEDHGIRAALAGVLSGAEPCRDREIALAGRDRETLLHVNTVPLFDQAGTAVGAAVTFEDVTEIRFLQRRVHETEKLAAMGELAVGVAHEVRNPLGAMKTSAQFLAARFAPGEAAHKLTQLIIREIDRLDQLVERLLDFARPAANDLQYGDVNELIERALALAVLKNRQKNLEIRKEYAPEPPPLLVDAKRLHQAFLNVMLNALDAMPDGGLLTIRTRAEPDGRRLRIEFGDTGEGIPSDKLDKVFNPFFTTRPHGTGLGLSIVHQIITEHNGDISVESAPGKGTTIAITLPLPFSGQGAACPPRVGESGAGGLVRSPSGGI